MVINIIPQHTPADELKFIKAIQAGDEDAINKLPKCNLGIVVSTARQYMNQGLIQQDLIEAGNKGLLEAARLFGTKEVNQFLRYALPFICRCMRQAIRASRIERTSCHVHILGTNKEDNE